MRQSYTCILISRMCLSLSACLCFILLVLQSCQKCELIDQEIVYPSNPCSGTFYFVKLGSTDDKSFTLNTLGRPITQPLNPVQKDGPIITPFDVLSMRSQFSTYDTVNEVYGFEFYRSNSIINRFYSYQTTNSISTFEGIPDFFVAPVYNNGRLFVLSVETLGSDLLYSINEIDPVTGQNGVGLLGNTITINSPADPQYFSSAAGKDGIVYFLGGTNLIEYNSVLNTTRYFDIDPSFNAIDNPVSYFGLEYDENQDRLLCMKTALDGPDTYRTTLVSITITPSGAQSTHAYDISSHLPTGHSPRINADQYSTAFDPCDTTYYITELNSFKPLTTNFIEVAVNRQTLASQVTQGYWLGLEVVGTE